MKRLIKNYTTGIPAEKTLAEIQKLLAENGATGIASEYEQGRLRDIFFKIKVNSKELAFRLPAKPEKVYAALHKGTLDQYHNRYGAQWKEVQTIFVRRMFCPFVITGHEKTSLALARGATTFPL